MSRFKARYVALVAIEYDRPMKDIGDFKKAKQIIRDKLTGVLQKAIEDEVEADKIEVIQQYADAWEEVDGN